MLDKLWAGSEATLQAYLDACEKGSVMQAKYDDEDAEDDLPDLLEIQGSVGVVSIKGPLTNNDSWFNKMFGITSYNDIREAVISAATNPEIGSILLDIDSGGGAVNGMFDTANLIRMVNDKVKPVVAFADGTMASAAYALGSSAGEVYSGKTALVGSIGVITTHMERSEALKKEGINVTVMRAGKYKALANPYEPLTDEAKAGLQRMMDAVYNVFVAHVADMRGKTVTYVDENMAQGREFVGEAAVGIGLVNGITSFDTLISGMQQPLDNTGKFKQYPQQDSYQGAPMKKALTGQQIVALAANGLLNAEQVQEEVKAEVPPAEAPAAEVAAEVPAAEAPAAEAQAEAPAVEAKSDAIVAFLQGQVAEKDKALLEANIELAQIKKEQTEFAAVRDGLLEVVSKSMNNMAAACDCPAIDVQGMVPLAVLAEHKRIEGMFLSKFKAGGVAAVDAAVADAEPVKIDPMHKIRLASVRATAKKANH